MHFVYAHGQKITCLIEDIKDALPRTPYGIVNYALQ